MDAIFTIPDRAYSFYKNPNWIDLIIILIALIFVGVFLRKYLKREQIELDKQKNEILLGLIANGFTAKGIKHLKETLKLCKENKPKQFLNYITLNKNQLSFFIKYPNIYKNVAAGKIVYEYKNLKNSNDIFGDLFWLGFNLCDLINNSVLDHLETSLLIANDGCNDLKMVHFYFDDLIQKSNVIEQCLYKLENNPEFKRFVIKKSIYHE